VKAPPRWLEQPEELPEELLGGMRAYGASGPSEAERAQMRVGLRLRTPSRLPAVLKSIAVLTVLVGIASYAWRAHTPVVVAPASPRRVEQPAPVIVESSPPVELQPAPAPTPPSAVHRKRAPAASDPSAELALLRRARRALAVTPHRALALAAEHSDKYPRGVFAEERELIAIEALAVIDRAAAKARARTFALDHPHSVHAARIQVLLAE
jgi:hypothetical protein